MPFKVPVLLNSQEKGESKWYGRGGGGVIKQKGLKKF